MVPAVPRKAQAPGPEAAAPLLEFVPGHLAPPEGGRQLPRVGQRSAVGRAGHHPAGNQNRGQVQPDCGDEVGRDGLVAGGEEEDAVGVTAPGVQLGGQDVELAARQGEPHGGCPLGHAVAEVGAERAVGSAAGPADLVGAEPGKLQQMGGAGVGLPGGGFD
jgi:hypothetical protein